MAINSLFLLALFVIILRIVWFNVGVIRQRKFLSINDKEANRFVSVIIPARNEEANIERCIRSVASNSYPLEKYEIIAVDDRSCDNTYNILLRLKNEIPNLRLVKVTTPHLDSNLQGKPGAIQSGIDLAKGEIFLFTDADCVVHKKWISKMTAIYENQEVALVASYTTVQYSNVFHKLQSMEWIYMHTLASAGLGINQPLGCFGNNLSIRAKDFNEIGGYSNITFSVTEDLALLQTIFDAGKRPVYICNSQTVVETLPLSRFRDYVRQHHRWTVGGLNLGWRATFFVASSAALWLGIIISLIAGELFWTFSFIFVRFAGDFSLLAPTLRILDLKKMIKWIVPSSLFFMLVELFVPFLLLKKNIKWKDQVLTNKVVVKVRSSVENSV